MTTDHHSSEENQAFQEATKETGRTWREHGNWFLGFAAMPLGSLRPDEKTRLWHQLLAIATLAARPTDKKGECLTGALSDEEMTAWRDAAEFALYTDWWAQAWWGSVVQLQQRLSIVLEEFWRTQRLEIPLHEAYFLMSPGQQEGRLIFPRHHQVTIGKHEARTGIEGAILYRFAQTLGHAGKRLRTCIGSKCQKLFIGGRTDQRYCTYNCLLRHHMAKKRHDMAKKRAAAQRKTQRTSTTNKRRKP